jgi:tripartite-type tricarboxylate transporter receptor subunit TctC
MLERLCAESFGRHAVPREEKTALFVRCVVALAAVAFALPPAGQTWPVKSIRLIVNFPAGGTTDQMALGVRSALI